VVGLELTLVRTPRYLRHDPTSGRLLYVPFLGHAQSYRVSRDAYQSSLEVYPPGFLSSEPTELVEVVLPPWRPRHWIVERHLLDPALPRHPRKDRRKSSALRALREEPEEDEEEYRLELEDRTLAARKKAEEADATVDPEGPDPVLP